MYKWITPDSIPPNTRDILLIVPDDEQCEAIVRGALAELLNPANYEQISGITPEETVDLFAGPILDTLDWVTP